VVNFSGYTRIAVPGGPRRLGDSNGVLVRDYGEKSQAKQKQEKSYRMDNHFPCRGRSRRVSMASIAWTSELQENGQVRQNWRHKRTNPPHVHNRYLWFRQNDTAKQVFPV